MEHPRISVEGTMSWQASAELEAKPGAAPEGTFSVFGVSWRVRSDDRAAFHVLLDHMPATSEASVSSDVARSYALRSAPAGGFELTGDDTVLARSSDLGDVANVFHQDLQWTVAERAPRRVFVRAAVVGWRDRTIVLPGGPRSGKSTLVRALVRLGATFFSDEYAVFDGTRVYPCPGRLPIWAEPGMRHAFGMDGVPREPRPLPVGIVVFTSFCPGALWRPKLLSRGQALIGMFGHALASRRDPERVLRVLDGVSRACHALEGVRGDAPGAAKFLLDRLV
jgi:hypothetical protein